MINILIAGDYSPKCRVSELIDNGEYEMIFGEVKKITSLMDYSVVNFESAITDGTDKPIKKYGPNLHCNVRSLDAIKWAGFDMLTLANNHFYDYGESSVEKTLCGVQKYGIDCVGAGRSLEEATRTVFKEIKGKVFAFINCCEHEFTIAKNNHGGCNPLNPIQQYYKIQEARKIADYVLVIVHGGHEMFQYPSLRMQETYRFFIDAGADVVVNHHQHCYSGYEFYNNKPIVYGLGNFCFDYAETPMEKCWYEGYFLQLVFDELSIRLQVQPYTQCKEEPTVHFLNKEDTFYREIEKINSIIANEEKLKQMIAEYYETTIKNSLFVFEPYNNRLLNVAYNRNLLPSFFRGKKILRANNYVCCESHLDKLRFALNHKLNSYSD